jgi:hypothetical protein
MRNLTRISGLVVLGFFSILLFRVAGISGASECAHGCVTTHNYDDSRDNVNPSESILKATTLGSLTAAHSVDLHGPVYTQPLYVSDLTTSGGILNAVFVATQENWVYALDGDHLRKDPVWQVNLNNAGEGPIPDSAISNCKSIVPEVGITGTPVIDRNSNILYVVSAHYNASSQTIVQRFNALNLSDGTPAAPPLDISAAYQGLGLSFDASVQAQRAALALSYGSGGRPLIYVAWASYCDSLLYTGKVAAFTYSAGNLSLLATFDDEKGSGKPRTPKGGIWMAGAAPAISATAANEAAPAAPIPNVFMSTGNGSVAPKKDYGESILRLHGPTSKNVLSLTGSYTINAWNILDQGSGKNCATPMKMPPPYPPGTTICSPGDFEVGSGGVILARPSGAGNLPPGDTFEVLAGGKQGVFYVLDPSNMKHTSADTQDPCGAYAIQCFAPVQLPLPCCTYASFGNRGGAAFWAGNSTYPENVLYVVGSEDSQIRGFQMNPGGGGTFNTDVFGYAPPPNPDGGGLIPYPGSSPVVTWNSDSGQPTDAILWVLDTSGFGNGSDKLYAYQALPAAAGGQLNLVWSDTTKGPKPTRFMVPTVINGHVFVGGSKPQGKKCSVGTCLGRVVSWQ